MLHDPLALHICSSFALKARICVRGDHQPVNEKETYTATLAVRSFRILMALAARWKFKARQLDAINAFPNSDLDEEVYVELPPGFNESGVVALHSVVADVIIQDALGASQNMIVQFLSSGRK